MALTEAQVKEAINKALENYKASEAAATKETVEITHTCF